MPTTIFTLKEYVNELKQIENAAHGKTESNVPSMKDLAKACDMEVTPFSRMINNQTDAISRKKLALLIAELRRLGFDPTFDQLFAYYD